MGPFFTEFLVGCNKGLQTRESEGRSRNRRIGGWLVDVQELVAIRLLQVTFRGSIFTYTLQTGITLYTIPPYHNLHRVSTRPASNPGDWIFHILHALRRQQSADSRQILQTYFWTCGKLGAVHAETNSK